MSRRRHFSETQKQRKKKSTQLLKRQKDAQRVGHTLAPAKFERSTEFNPQDVKFLEAMRDMGVRVQPGRTASPDRERAAEGLHIRREKKDEGLFEESMSSLGVQPLRGSSKPMASTPTVQNADTSEDQAPPHHVDAPADLPPAGLSSPQSQPAFGESLPGISGSENSESGPADDAEDTAESSPADDGEDSARSGSKTKAAPTTAPIQFDMRSGDSGLMEDALAMAAEDMDLKYAGAPPQSRGASRRPPTMPTDGSDPDSELDLHGKTVEQAIQMVQNFMLTSYRQGLRHVLIITGKGNHSGQQGAVLQDAVFHWLERNASLYAHGFERAPSRHGGSGAIWVVLRDWQANEER